MKRLFFSILILILSSIAVYYILSFWKGISLYQSNLSRETLLEAIRAIPSNPDPYYRLGLFYQWDMLNVDLRESLKYLKEGIRRNPLEQEYWLNVARIYARMGERQASERALENSVLVFPTGYQGRWVSGNLLQQEDIEKALPHFSYILANYPNQAPLIYDVLRKTIPDSDFILEKLVPKDPSSFKQYLSTLYEVGDKESAQKAWREKGSFGYQADRKETLRHIEFLISRGDGDEAFKVWKARLQEEGISTSDSDLITNGGFEKEKILGGGFDWKIEKVPGAEISFDPSIAFEGKSSLKIVFNGKENVDFHHLYQFVPLKPNNEYALKAMMKTQALTTKSGLKIEILGIGPAFYKTSEPLIGDNEWKEVVVNFRTPAQTQVGMVRVRRNKTDKFDRYLSGTVWIDHVRLTEK